MFPDRGRTVGRPMVDPMSLQMVKLRGGQIIQAHTIDTCEGGFCCIHQPSQHHMVEWRQNWRDDAGKMERLCSHGIGHPDPDDLHPNTVHGCDGCCAPPGEIFLSPQPGDGG